MDKIHGEFMSQFKLQLFFLWNCQNVPKISAHIIYQLYKTIVFFDTKKKKAQEQSINKMTQHVAGSLVLVFQHLR
jgi:hypothetical protein